MKYRRHASRALFVALLMVAKSLAVLENVMIEPAMYQRDRYISADEFKLVKYQKDSEHRESYGNNPNEINNPIDVETMVFTMEDMSKLYDKSGSDGKQAQIFTFQNNEQEYMTGIKGQYVSMGAKLPNNSNAQLWHLIFIRKDNQYMFMSMAGTNMCLTIVPMQATTNPHQPSETYIGLNLKLTKCDLLKPEQRYVIKKIHPIKDDTPEIDGASGMEGLDTINKQNIAMNDQMSRNMVTITEMLRAMSQSLIHIQEKLFGHPTTQFPPVLLDTAGNPVAHNGVYVSYPNTLEAPANHMYGKQPPLYDPAAGQLSPWKAPNSYPGQQPPPYSAHPSQTNPLGDVSTYPSQQPPSYNNSLASPLNRPVGEVPPYSSLPSQNSSFGGAPAYPGTQPPPYSALPSYNSVPENTLNRPLGEQPPYSGGPGYAPAKGMYVPSPTQSYIPPPNWNSAAPSFPPANNSVDMYPRNPKPGNPTVHSLIK
ncbi:uncharacterized protein NESG_01124 [Nematocida ausubeli]|uniref:Uncharacterized protein n=1 Tax=Nematocida ausubeli (strain ATCC PRA-371 / ERTm2) TaxID=1913371 RepID=A0A086J1J4_NEMA1|nr:uncharacterized protein NESG_01124 [Nematocida ausubeli]KAI5132508.1 hypothetical protein NEAUS07_0170 [Nematocida ausubeli]KAI5147047.1 hypothetical protein NEAUS05_0378 [Nematocida ausubeli]KFG26012.1 hypothetical protein NESG_01124 [Nematocida ausubeli]